MKRAYNSFSVLQAVAATAALAVTFWSLGLPSFHFAEAANVTSYSDTLSDSAPSVVSNHTIEFTTPTGVANGETIIIDFSDGPFDINLITFADIDVATSTGDFTLAADCTGADQIGAATSSNTIVLTMCSGDGGLIAAGGTTTIQIGTNADSGVNQITNPAAGSYEINLNAGSVDTGSTRVAIIPSVEVTASVNTSFTFTVAGVAGGQTVNVADTTGASTTATEIPFGTLTNGNASTTAQDLTVVTNATNGFVVTVTADSQLVSATGADIDGFRNGTFDSTPQPWEGPTPVVGNEETYGHWGLTSDDPSLTGGDIFQAGTTGNRFVSASTTPVEVFRNTGPSDGTGTGDGTTRVGYKVEISALQEAADDYTATLTYVATPVF